MSEPVRWQTTDDVFIRAPQKRIARRLLDLADDSSWWPGVRARGTYGYVEVDAPAGRPFSRARFGAIISPVREWEGFTWTINQGDLAGRAEWWLEAFGDGTIVHYYLDLARAPGRRLRRTSASVRRHRWAIRRGLNALKDDLEAATARPTGSPAAR